MLLTVRRREHGQELGEGRVQREVIRAGDDEAPYEGAGAARWGGGGEEDSRVKNGETRSSMEIMEELRRRACLWPSLIRGCIGLLVRPR